VAEVGPASPAAEAGVQQGDVILQANQTPVGSVKELQRIVDQATKKTGVVLLLLSRQGNNLFVSVELSE
jgi:serine protease Do